MLVQFGSVWGLRVHREALRVAESMPVRASREPHNGFFVTLVLEIGSAPSWARRLGQSSRNTIAALGRVGTCCSLLITATFARNFGLTTRS